MAKIKADVQAFVTDAFDYLSNLDECSINHSANRYLLEHIAHGYVQYGSTQSFIEHINDWIRSLIKVFPELTFDDDSNQIKAVIDLQDQLVVVDDELMSDLQYIIDVQTKYGLLIEFKKKDGTMMQTTLARFFEYIESYYPSIKERYKGLGSSDAKVSKEVIMDPRTRRIVRVKMEDLDTMKRMGVLVGKSKDEITARKDLLLNFNFTKDMIDN